MEFAYLCFLYSDKVLETFEINKNSKNGAVECCKSGNYG